MSGSGGSGWGELAVQAGAAYANYRSQDKAAEAGSQASQQGTDADIAERRRQYDQSRQDQMPWMAAGAGALGQMQALNAGDYSSFKQSPDYQFNVDQQMQGLDRSAAARGSLYSGGADADRMKMMSGLASQQYGQYYSRLSDLATGGNATAGALGSLGANMANGIGNAYQNNAFNQRQSAYDRSNAYTGAVGQAANSFGQWYGNNSKKNNGGTGWYMGQNEGPG